MSGLKKKNPKYASNPPKFRYLIREIKQRIDGLKLSSADGGWDVEM